MATASPSVPGRATATRLDVQGLRALAVILVIADHLFGYPIGGFIGVDVFFVISGYLITGLLLREHSRTGRISIRAFYARRARRILPASAVVLAATVIAASVLFATTRAASAIVDALWAAAFLGNWRMAATGTDYFQLGLPPSPVQHFWSLSVEEQFYFVWPVLLIGVLGFAARRKYDLRGRRTIVGIVLAAIVLVSFFWAIIETTSNPTVAYFSTFSRAWELAAGALAATVGSSIITGFPPVVRALASWIGLAGIFVSALILRPDHAFPAPGAALAVGATVLILVAGSGAPSRAYDRALFPLTNRVASYIGDISYSLYLWHFPIVIFLLTIFPSDSRRYYSVAVVLMVGLAAASYHFVEQPVRRSRWLSRFTDPAAARLMGRARVRSRAILSAIAASAAVVILVAAGSVVSAESTRPPPTSVASDLRAGCFGAAAFENATECAAESPQTEVVPSLEGFEKDTGIAFSCYRPKGTELKSCAYGDASESAVRVALVGDSHAASLLPALEPQLISQGWSLDTYLGYGCQWRLATGSDCDKAMNEIQAALTDRDHPYDIIITTAARWANGEDPAASAATYADAWTAAAAVGTRIIAVADVPGVSDEALLCITRIGYIPGTTECSTDETAALAVADPLATAARSVDGAIAIDLTKYFCAAGSCPAVAGGVIVYRDTSGHITATYSSTLGPYLVDAIAAEIR